MNYYNEWDPFAAAWLRNLIAAGLLPPGDVDERSIADVQPADLEGYTQHHFFAGIGGWPLALAQAGWPSDAPIWTGSCPCQPFSIAGRSGGTADSRHLWPQFQRLIAVCNPPVVFGEQVAGLAGRGWLARVRADLEALGYAVGVADLCAASLGAPHIRSRLWWVADAVFHERERWDAIRSPEPEHAGAASEDEESDGSGRGASRVWSIDGPPDGSAGSRMGNTDSERRNGESVRQLGRVEAPWPSAGSGFWDDAGLIPCLDGKSRRIEPGTSALAAGFPGRVGQLRAYGNAIVPQVAAEFVKAYLLATVRARREG